jgi:DNA polymerase V
VLERTVLELQGEACLAFDDVEPQRKGMAVTRSSGQPMMDFDTVFQAVTAHATRAAEKLRQHGLVAGTLTVFFHTNRHRMDRPQYSGSRSTRMTPMSSDTFDLVNAARRCAQAAWPKTGSQTFGFTKAGILLNDLILFEDRPKTLFDVEKTKSAAVMTALDQVNNRFGKKAMVLASEGMTRSWQLRSNHRSPRYTTRLADLPVVR